MNVTPAVERLDMLRDSLDQLVRAGRVGGWPAPLIGAATALGAALEDLAGALYPKQRKSRKARYQNESAAFFSHAMVARTNMGAVQWPNHLAAHRHLLRRSGPLRRSLDQLQRRRRHPHHRRGLLPHRHHRRLRHHRAQPVTVLRRAVWRTTICVAIARKCATLRRHPIPERRNSHG